MIHSNMTLLSIYTDGACVRNGKPNAKSSYAFFCLENHYKEVGTGEWDGKHSNNTGELKAILQALRYAVGKTKWARIFSDSKYAINSSSIWLPDRKPAKGTRIKNYDLIKIKNPL